MIVVQDLCKCFDDIQAVQSVSLKIEEGCIFGLVGTNGSGKSTFLRMAAGILKADEGSLIIDGHPVYENETIKEQIFYIPEDAYFFPNSTAVQMMEYYSTIYPHFDKTGFLELLARFHLDGNRRIQTFSKGMKKQVSILLGLSSQAKYLLCDETFDGLDPVMRQAVKSLFADGVMNRGLTPVIASHNLRELEDICDHIGVLHQGGILLSEQLEELKFHIHKLQCVLKSNEAEARLLNELDVIRSEKSGSLLFATVRGTQMEILHTVERCEPVFSEIVPLSLEEIFICEMEAVGYEIKNILF